MLNIYSILENDPCTLELFENGKPGINPFITELLVLVNGSSVFVNISSS